MPTHPGSMMAHLTQQPPDTIYHYTSLDAMRHIVEEGKIWASDVQFLNDSTEYTYLLEIMQVRVAKLAELAVEGARKTSLLELGTLLIHGLPSETFVACFSERRDDLSQWRGYSSAGTGACIGFSSKAVNPMTGLWELPEDERGSVFADRGTASLVKCIYIDRTFESQFDAAIEQAMNTTANIFPTSVFAFSMLASLADFHKNNQFRAEEEWRYRLRPSIASQKIEGVKFRMGKSNLIPYAEVDIRRRNPRFINEIVIGPTPNMALSVKAVEKLLKLNGMEYVSINPSDVPYRHW